MLVNYWHLFWKILKNAYLPMMIQLLHFLVRKVNVVNGPFVLTSEVYTGGLVYSTDETLETLLQAVVTGHRLIYYDKLEVSCYFQTHWWIEACSPQCCHVRVEPKQIEKDADSRLMFQVSSLSSKTHRISPLALLPFDYHFTQPAAPTFRWEMYY